MIPRPTLRVALAHNLGASIISGLMQLCLVPVYAVWMGMESYGIIGVQIAISGFMQIFDAGMAMTLNREMAGGGDGAHGVLKNLLRAFETVYFAEGFLVAALLFMGVSVLSHHWLSPKSLTPETIELSLRLMSIAIFGQWMCGLYMAGLLGLEQHRTFSLIRIIATLVSHLGNVCVLFASSGSVIAFMAWQATFCVALAVTYRIALHSSLRAQRSAIDWRQVLRHWRFATGMGLIGVVAVLILNLDKWALSTMLSLSDFGSYCLAYTIVGGLLLVTNPVYNITFPRLAALVRAGEPEATARCYQRQSELMAWLLMPMAGILIFKAQSLMLVWNGRPDLAAAVSPIVTWGAIGGVANALMVVPYTLQLANGRTRMGLQLSLFMLGTLVVALWVLVPRYGAIGGAASLCIANLVYLVSGLPWTSRALVPVQHRTWLVTMVPLILAAMALPAVDRFVDALPSATRIGQFFRLGALYGLSAVLSAFFARRIFPLGPWHALRSFLSPSIPG